MNKFTIEARLNECATRNKNKHVRWLPIEIAADAAECLEAGASLARFHGRDASGAPDHRFETRRDLLAVQQSSSNLPTDPQRRRARQGARASGGRS